MRCWRGRWRRRQDLLLLDEPLNAVDAQTRSVFDEVCAELRRAGKTVIMATHDLVGLETRFDEILCLCAGRAQQEPPDRLRPVREGVEAAWAG